MSDVIPSGQELVCLEHKDYHCWQENQKIQEYVSTLQLIPPTKLGAIVRQSLLCAPTLQVRSVVTGTSKLEVSSPALPPPPSERLQATHRICKGNRNTGLVSGGGSWPKAPSRMLDQRPGRIKGQLCL